MIKVVDLYKKFGSHNVHNGINLEIKKGAITYIIGPSGTGKSVLLKQLMGLIKPDSGSIYIDGAETMEIVNEKLKLVGLSGVNNRFPSELSGGMRKRVGLARAIALSPDIMMYDEPTTGLDPIMTDVVDDLIYTTQKELNITSVVISHDIPSVLKNADYIGMLYNGRIIQYGTPEYFKTTDNPYVRQFFSGSKDGPIKVY